MNARADKRLQQDKRCLHEVREITLLEYPQREWMMLVMSAVPLANHATLILFPTVSHTYSDAHDRAICKTLCAVLGADALGNDATAMRVVILPGRLVVSG